MSTKSIQIDYKAEKSLRGKLALWLLEKGTPLHASLHPEREPWNLTSEDFLKMPQGSLGHELGKFYAREKFEPIPRAERHDVFHVLLGYSTGVLDEARMQFFLWGNGKPSVFTIGTALITLGLFPEAGKNFISEWKRGKDARSIAKWDFHQLLRTQISELRQRIFKEI